MKTAYEILGLPQDATLTEIARSQITALKSRKYAMRDITEAQSKLRKPSSRLAEDFCFPVLDKGEITPLKSATQSVEINLDSLNADKYDSLK